MKDDGYHHELHNGISARVTIYKTIALLLSSKKLIIVFFFIVGIFFISPELRVRTNDSQFS